MQAPLRTGDVCMVVRDLVNPSDSRCYAKLIGTPLTLAAQDVNGTWHTEETIVCPGCKAKLPFVFSKDLQRLRRPRAADRRLHNVNEDGHGWRLVDTEVAA